MRSLPLLFATGLLACSPASPSPSPPPEAAAAPPADATPSTVAAVAVHDAHPTGTDAVAVDRGAAVFAQHCAACHGPTGRGDTAAGRALDPPAADLVGPRAEHLRGIPRRRIIEEGRPGTAMVGWKAILSAEDLDAVYGFVHDLKHRDDGGPGRHGGGHGRHGGGPGRHGG